LARALLREPRLLCLDEATANVDPTNDQRIQRVLSQEVAESLVLTIAHRLHTVMQSDRILVLDKGRLAQFDAPQSLLSTPGIFKELAAKAGIHARYSCYNLPSDQNSDQNSSYNAAYDSYTVVSI